MGSFRAGHSGALEENFNHPEPHKKHLKDFSGIPGEKEGLRSNKCLSYIDLQLHFFH